jgi:predicted ArsR family transcriptional regulator
MTLQSSTLCKVETAPENTLPEHPIRVALLDLLAELGTVTANEASRRLGHSSGLCSFHLRQLARLGLIEEAPRGRGRIKPWRLRWESEARPAQFDLHAEHPEDDTFSATLHLTPAERNELAESMRKLIKRYQDRAPERDGTRTVRVDFQAFPAHAERTGQ